jgi:voltage-gated sodium channel
VQRHSLKARANEFIDSRSAQNFIVLLILINAVTPGLKTSELAQRYAGGLLLWLERAVLTVFVVEIALKLFAFGPRFSKAGETSSTS